MQPQLEHYSRISSLPKVFELYEHLNEQVFSLKHLDLPQRTVSNWDDVGLITIQRDGEKNWRRLSFFEFLWTKFVNELREVGIPLSVILKVKENLLSDFDLNLILSAVKLNPELWRKSNESKEIEELFAQEDVMKNVHINLFMLLAVDSIARRIPISILVFMDGTSIIWYKDQNEHLTETEILRKEYESHANIPISGLFKKFIVNPKTYFALPKMNLLTKEEDRLLEYIHSNEYSSITINFKDNRMKSLELVKEQDVKKRITDVLADGSYQDIVIKKHGGVITRIQNTIKISL